MSRAPTRNGGDYLAAVYILIGIPGAGKTTYAKSFPQDTVYLGTDSIRKELFGKELTLRGRKRVYDLLFSRLLAALKMNRDVVIDCTNFSVQRRKRILSQIPLEYKRIAVFLNTPLPVALQNNKHRKRHVPIIGVVLMHLQLQRPRVSEGFHEIIEVEPNSVTRLKKNGSF